MKIETEIEFEPTPEELAEEFCHLYDNAQVKFLNKVAEIFSEADRLAMQLEYISQSKLLSDNARYLMEKMGEYARHNK